MNKGFSGHTHSAEARARMSAASKGNTRNLGHRHTAEARAKMSADRRGRVVSSEARANLSLALKGKPKSAQHRDALRGRVLSLESRAKMSASKMGQGLGRPKSAETRARMVAAWKRGRSPETLLKLSKNSKLAWADGRMRVPKSHRYTTLARALHAHLEKQGLALEVEVRFGPYTVDLYDRAHHVAYEADCVCWHSKNEAKRPGYHAQRDNYLISGHGLKVVRYTDKEISALTGWPKTKREDAA